MWSDARSDKYEVLSPWAEVDPSPVRGLSPRLADLEGKTIGLFDDHKPTASLILGVVETRLKQRFPTLTFSRFRIRHGVLEEDTAGEERAKLAAWASGVDAVVAAVGD